MMGVIEMASGPTIREKNGRASRNIKHGPVSLYEQTAAQITSKARAQKIRDDKARQASISGREDLPSDPLGILFGHNQITGEQYDEGRRLEWLMTRRFGPVHPAACGLYREVVTPDSDTTDIAVYREPISDEAVRKSVDNAFAILKSINRRTLDAVENAIRYYHVGGHRRIDIPLIVKGLDALLHAKWQVYHVKEAA